MKVTPYAMESLTSFVHRSACMQSMDTRSYLRHLFPSESYQHAIEIPDDLDAIKQGSFLVGLNDALDREKRRMSLLTLPGTAPGIHTKWLRREGGNSVDGDRFSTLPAFAWCPRCLLTDQLEGHDQFLRLSWRTCRANHHNSTSLITLIPLYTSSDTWWPVLDRDTPFRTGRLECVAAKVPPIVNVNGLRNPGCRPIQRLQ